MYDAPDRQDLARRNLNAFSNGVVMHTGSPATLGGGPNRYGARIVFEISPFDQLRDDSGGSFELAGFPASIVREDHCA